MPLTLCLNMDVDMDVWEQLFLLVAKIYFFIF